MQYTALYRKFRPKFFDDVVGQDHITKTLKTQICTNNVSHAYLLCGSRGTGKTTVAKIFSKALNCINNQNGEPCNTCDVCSNISENIDIIEIDAASNNSVDNVRDIREEIKYPPTFGKFKIYIIDEVHMLSSGAFNALLKTLEDPPKFVIFILATTDPQKIPATVLSRCQRYDYKRISIFDMSYKIKQYMIQEKIKIKDDAIEYISSLSEGSMRDALSILDQCISYYYFCEEITLDQIKALLGCVFEQVFYEIFDALNCNNTLKCLEIINNLFSEGKDISLFLRDFLTFLRNILIIKSTDKYVDILDISLENFSKLKNFSNTIDIQTVTCYIDTLSDFLYQLKYFTNIKINFEILFIKMCNQKIFETHNNLSKRLLALEQKLENDVDYVVKAPAKKEFSAPNIKKVLPDDIQNIVNNYKTVIKNFAPNISSMLEMGYAGFVTNDVLYFVLKDNITSDLLKNKKDTIKEELFKIYKKEFNIEIISEENYNELHKNFYGYKDYQKVEFDLADLKSKINIQIKEFD